MLTALVILTGLAGLGWALWPGVRVGIALAHAATPRPASRWHRYARTAGTALTGAILGLVLLILVSPLTGITIVYRPTQPPAHPPFAAASPPKPHRYPTAPVSMDSEFSPLPDFCSPHWWT